MSRITRALTVTAATFAMVTLAAPFAAAAPAAGLPADFDFYMPTGGYSVASYCALAAGYSTDPRHVTWVVEATAVATGPSVGVGTSVECTVYDALDKSRTYGGASRGLPGGAAIAVGTATVPVGRVPAVCVRGAAIFLDGTSIDSDKECP